MHPKKCCQMFLEDGSIEECGFLVGGRCKADPKRPFIIDGAFRDHLKIVGCNSWSKYLDYESQRQTSEMPGVQDERVGRNRDGIERKETLPVPVLQTGDNDRRHPNDGQPSPSGVNCFCGEKIYRGKMCAKHYDMWCRGASISRMKKEDMNELQRL